MYVFFLLEYLLSKYLMAAAYGHPSHNYADPMIPTAMNQAMQRNRIFQHSYQRFQFQSTQLVLTALLVSGTHCKIKWPYSTSLTVFCRLTWRRETCLWPYNTSLTVFCRLTLRWGTCLWSYNTSLTVFCRLTLRWGTCLWPYNTSLTVFCRLTLRWGTYLWSYNTSLTAFCRLT